MTRALRRAAGMPLFLALYAACCIADLVETALAALYPRADRAVLRLRDWMDHDR